MKRTALFLMTTKPLVMWGQGNTPSGNSNFSSNNHSLNGAANASDIFGTPPGSPSLNVPPPPPPTPPSGSPAGNGTGTNGTAPSPSSNALGLPPLPTPTNSSAQTNVMGLPPLPTPSNSGVTPAVSSNGASAPLNPPAPVSSNSPPTQLSPSAESTPPNNQASSEPKKDFLNASLQEYTSVRYNGALLHDVMGALAAAARINIVISSKIEKTIEVNLRLTNVTYETVIKTILSTLEYDYIVENGIMRILPRADVMKEKSEKEERNKLSKKLEAKKILIRHIKHANAGDIEQLVSKMINDAKSEKNPSGGDNLGSSNGLLKIQSDKRTNSLLIHGTQEDLSLANEIINKLDKKKTQVLIEARIVEASNDLAKTLGISWGSRFGLDGQRGFNSGLVFPSSIRGTLGGAGTIGAAAPVFEKSAAPQFGSFNFSLGSLNGLLNLDGILKAYETENMANVIASPRIVVQDQEKATISDSTTSKAASTGEAAGTNSANVSLDVTPQVANDGQVELTLTVNRTSSNPTSQSTTNKTATTKLVVKNGDTAVIGGLYQTSRVRTQGRIPVLGKLPLIGFLFRNTTDEWMRTELLVMITPRIQSTADETVNPSVNTQAPAGSTSGNTTLNRDTPPATNVATDTPNSNSGNANTTTPTTNNSSGGGDNTPLANPLNNSALNNGGLNSNGL